MPFYIQFILVKFLRLHWPCLLHQKVLQHGGAMPDSKPVMVPGPAVQSIWPNSKGKSVVGNDAGQSAMMLDESLSRTKLLVCHSFV